MTILKVKSIKSKVPHKCSGCLRTFPEDTKMIYEAVASNGTVNSIYICNSCHNVIKNTGKKVVKFYPGDFYKDAIKYETYCI